METYEECIKIIEDKNKLNHKDLEDKWEKFKEKFPKLYMMLTLQEKIDLTLLKYLCETADKQNLLNKKEEKTEIDFEVGDKLADKFIYNKFNRPTNEQENFIKETLRKKINNNTQFSVEDGRLP